MELALLEYIVGFNGYYTERARTGFIRAALRDANVATWFILPRHNILSSHPSDFDVIKVSFCQAYCFDPFNLHSFALYMFGK